MHRGISVSFVPVNESNGSVISLALFYLIFLNLLNTFKCEEWCKVASLNADIRYEQCLSDGDGLATYAIHVLPLTSRNEDLPSDVSIKIIGDGKETKPIKIATKDGTLTRVTADRLDVGNPKSIEVYMDSLNWMCKRITIFKGPKYWVFDCVPAGDISDQNSTKTTYMLSGNKIYIVDIQTGSQKGADTNGTIMLTLVGPLGRTNPKILRNNFYAGSYLTFQIKAADIGEPNGLILTNSANADPWYCEDVRITTQDALIKSFPIKRWIGDPYDRSIEVSTELGTRITNFNETSPIDIQCHTRAMDIYSGVVKKHFNVTVRCPINCQMGSLIHVEGSSLHPSSTSICGASLFDGVISPSGGEVVVSIVGPLRKYFGSTNPDNRMKSENYEPSGDQSYYSFFTFLNESIDNIDSDVRLVDAFGKLTSFGRLEVIRNGKWGTVCKKGKFGAFNGGAAELVCKKLGFNYGIQIMENCSSVNDQNLCAPSGYGVSYSGLMCLGTEDNVDKCIIEEPTIDCLTHRDDVIVKCTNVSENDAISYGTLRLVDNTGAPSVTGIGRLEIYNNGFGSICNESWTKTAEKLACLEMGYSGLHNGGLSNRSCSDVNGINFCAPITTRIVAANFKCKGTEKYLNQCQHDSDDEIFCTHEQDVIVSCSGDGDPSEFRKKKRIDPYTPKMKKLNKVVNLTCYDNLSSHVEFKNKIGSYTIALCPEGCRDEPSAVKGTFIYTEDSPICKAAIHSGVIGDNGGEIVVINGINQPFFYGSSMNGLISMGFSRVSNGFEAGSFMVSKVTGFIMSMQLKQKHPKRSHKESDFKPVTAQSLPATSSKFLWLPDYSWKGFNGKASDYVNLKHYPGAEAIKTFKDLTFIVDMVPTGTIGRWSTIFSFQNCGGFTCSIDNFGELIMQENCKAHLLRTSHFPQIGRRTSMAIIYYSLTHNVAIFIDGKMVISKETEFDFSFQGDLIIGKAADTDSDFFVGQILSFEAFDYVMSPEQIKQHHLINQSSGGTTVPHQYSSIRMTTEGNLCLSKCTNIEVHKESFEDIFGVGPTNPAIHLICGDTLNSEHFNGPTGKEFLFFCSESCIDTNFAVKGSKIYASDSSICKSAAHAGVIPREGGEAIVTILHGLTNYERCRGHYGILSEESNKPCLRSFAVRRAPKILHLSCLDNALFVLKMHPGTRMLLRCPPGCKSAKPTNVFGTGIYNPVSSLCQAAIHSGKLDDNGGEVEIEVENSQHYFHPSNAHGILSQYSGQYLKSFKVLRATRTAV